MSVCTSGSFVNGCICGWMDERTDAWVDVSVNGRRDDE